MVNEGISGGRRNTDLVRNNLTGYYFDKTPDGNYYFHGTNIQANPFVDYSDYNFGLDEDGGDVSESKTVSKINAVAGVTSLTMSVISNTLTSTRLGSDIAYSLSNSKIFLTSVKYLKPVGYGASVVSVGTDVILSIDGSQSWTETVINSGVTIGTIFIGGWEGVVIQLDYQGAKFYIKTSREHPEWILPASYHCFKR